MQSIKLFGISKCSFVVSIPRLCIDVSETVLTLFRNSETGDAFDTPTNPFHPRLTDDEYEFISRAVKAGCAVSALGRKPGTRSKDDVNYSARTTAKPLMSRLNNLTDTHSIFLETGIGLEVLDIDCKNDAQGFQTLKLIEKHMPPVFGEVTTPSGGKHFYVAATGLAGIRHGGIDVQGLGQGVFAPGSNRGKYHGKSYVIVQQLVVDRLAEPTLEFREALLELKRKTMQRVDRWPPSAKVMHPASQVMQQDAHLSGPYSVIAKAQHFASIAPIGERNRSLYNQAFTATAYIGLDNDRLTKLQCVLIEAARVNGLLAEDGLDQCLTTINSGINDAHDMLAKGEK
jgi:hypothetical protein